MKKRLTILLSLLSLFSIDTSYSSVHRRSIPKRQELINRYKNLTLEFEEIKESQDEMGLENLSDKTDELLLKCKMGSFGFHDKYQEDITTIKELLALVKMKIFLLEYGDVKNVRSPKINSEERFQEFIKKIYFLEEFFHMPCNEQSNSLDFHTTLHLNTDCRSYFSDIETDSFYKIINKALSCNYSKNTSFEGTNFCKAPIFRIEKRLSYANLILVNDFLSTYGCIESIDNYIKFKEFKDMAFLLDNLLKRRELLPDQSESIRQTINQLIKKTCEYKKYIYPPFYLPNLGITFRSQYSLVDYKNAFLSTYNCAESIMRDFEQFKDIAISLDELCNPLAQQQFTDWDFESISEIDKLQIVENIDKLIAEIHEAPYPFQGSFSFKYINKRLFLFETLIAKAA